MYLLQIVLLLPPAITRCFGVLVADVSGTCGWVSLPWPCLLAVFLWQCHGCGGPLLTLWYKCQKPWHFPCYPEPPLTPEPGQPAWLHHQLSLTFMFLPAAATLWTSNSLLAFWNTLLLRSKTKARSPCLIPDPEEIGWALHKSLPT